jgi:uncharacterized membrane protein
MKVAATVLVILALLIAVVPIFTDCVSAGRMLTLADGREIPMKCHWTGRAELGLGIPLLAVGLTMVFSRRKESYRNLGLVGITLGAVTILLPTALIVVCGNPDMPCNSIMKPALTFMGILVIGTSLVVVIRNWRQEQDIA